MLGPQADSGHLVSSVWLCILICNVNGLENRVVEELDTCAPFGLIDGLNTSTRGLGTDYLKLLFFLRSSLHWTEETTDWLAKHFQSKGFQMLRKCPIIFINMVCK